MIGGRDKQRIASKIGQEQMRILAMLVMTLKGPPLLYMGDEIGRERVPIPPDCVHDLFEKLVKGYGFCRDPERAPMRWDDSAKGGFTTDGPWPPLEPDGSRNVARQKGDERSILHSFGSSSHCDVHILVSSAVSTSRSGRATMSWHSSGRWMRAS